MNDTPVRRRLALVAAATIALLHAAAILFAVTRHEPWFDEAQAWLIARDASTAEIVTRYAGYEGTPVLWHLLLSIPANLGLPYRSMGLLSAAASIFATGLLLLRSPFPWPVRALIPFSYWLLFQYGAVARSYSLLAPLSFALALLWPRRLERPVRLFVVLALLANVSAHGFLIAAGVAAIHSVGVLRQWRHLTRRARIRHAGSAAAFGLLSLAVALQVRPPPDIAFPGAQARNLPEPSAAFDYAQAMVRGGLANGILLSVLPLVAAVAWFIRARCFLIWLVPTAAVVGLSTFQYGNVWHQGILMVVLLFTFWISLQRTVEDPLSVWLRRGALAGLGVVLAVQTSWSVLSLRYDLRQAYSGAAQAAAEVASDRAVGRPVAAVGFSSMAIQPYFEENVFSNYPPDNGGAFWFWSNRRVMLDRISVDGRPVVIVVQDKRPHRPAPHPPPDIPGYAVAGHYRGALFFKTKVIEQEGFYLLRPISPPSDDGVMRSA